MVKTLVENVILLQADVAFISANANNSYWSTIVFTKVLDISQGGDGLDTVLIESAESWDTPVWPTFAWLQNGGKTYFFHCFLQMNRCVALLTMKHNFQNPLLQNLIST